MSSGVIRLEAYPSPMLSVSHNVFKVYLRTQSDKEEWRTVLELTAAEASMLSVLLARIVADIDREQETSRKIYDAERVRRNENRT